MHNHGRRGGYAIAAALALALIGPSTAFAGHDLVVYKKEIQIDLVSDEQTHSVSCDVGDHVLDGMWRIDHADQDDYVPELPLIAGAVDVIQAYPSSDRTYTFSFVKNAIGRAQVKIFVTCLADKTSGGPHQHSFSTAFVDSGGAPLPGTYDSQTQPVTGSAVKPLITSAAATCPNKTRLVSPGFKADNLADPAPGADPNAGMMRLFESIASNQGRDWSWKWENSALPVGYSLDLTTYWRCLKIRVPQNSFDKHKLALKFTRR